jgi:hypothetical protein
MLWRQSSRALTGGSFQRRDLVMDQVDLPFEDLPLGVAGVQSQQQTFDGGSLDAEDFSLIGEGDIKISELCGGLDVAGFHSLVHGVE